MHWLWKYSFGEPRTAWSVARCVTFCPINALSDPDLLGKQQNAVAKFDNNVFIDCGVRVWLNKHSDNSLVYLSFCFARHSYRLDIIFIRMWYVFGVHNSVKIYPTISMFKLGRPKKGVCKFNDDILSTGQTMTSLHVDIVCFPYTLWVTSIFQMLLAWTSCWSKVQ